MANGEVPRSWGSRRPKIEAWSPPLPDADVESELKRASRTLAGPELEKEAKLLEELFKPPPQSLDQLSPRTSAREPGEATCPPSLLQQNEIAMQGDESYSPKAAAPQGRTLARALRSLLMQLPILARVVDMVEGLSPALSAVAATSSRWFCACHLVRIATYARRLRCLERALRFRSHLDFKAADTRVDDVAINLEVAADLIELEASQLRSLMGARSESGGSGASASLGAARKPPLAAKMAALALHELLIGGRPEYAELGSNTGAWQQDRRILDPAILTPLLVRYHRGSISRDAQRRLKSVLCAHLDLLTPSAVLQSSGASKAGKRYLIQEDDIGFSDAGTEVERWRIAAAAVLQWAWVQLAHEELECDRTAHLGALEKSLLLQPSIGSRRIERSRKLVLEKLEILRSEPLLGRLLHAPLDAQVASGVARVLVRASPRAAASSLHADRTRQPRLASASLAGRQQQSLPSLQGLYVGGTAPASASTPVRGEPKRYLIGDSHSVPSLSLAAKSVPAHECFRRGPSKESRTRNGLMVPRLALREKDLDKAPEGQGRNALAAWPRSLRSEVTLREALGFPRKDEKDPATPTCADDVSTAEGCSPPVSDRWVARCTPKRQAWRRPGSAPAHLPWSSPGLRFCTPLRA